MLLPGTDPITMLIELVPLLLLYEISIQPGAVLRGAGRDSRRGGRGRRVGRPARRLIYSQAVLFDLRGKRKRVVQVVYVMLAAIFLIGFIGFGIGVGGGPGGIFDALGIGGGGSGSGSSAFSDQLSKRRGASAQEPEGRAGPAQPRALRVPLGTVAAGPPDATTGLPALTEDAQSEFSKAVDDWNRYVEVADKPDPAVACQVAQAFVYLNDAAGAAKAEEIFAKARPEPEHLRDARPLPLRRRPDLRRATPRRRRRCPWPRRPPASGLTKQFASLRKRAAKHKQAQKAANSSGGKKNPGAALQNPFSGLTPTPTTPAP